MISSAARRGRHTTMTSPLRDRRILFATAFVRATTTSTLGVSLGGYLATLAIDKQCRRHPRNAEAVRRVARRIDVIPSFLIPISW